MIRHLERLLRLSELRLGEAERHLEAMRLGLKAAEAGLARVEAEALAMAIQTEARRNAAREAFIGATQTRAAVEDLMLDLKSFDRAEAAAADQVTKARNMRDAARPPVAEAVAAMCKAQAAVEKRKALVRQARQQVAYASELSEAQEAEEQWIGQRAVGGTE